MHQIGRYELCRVVGKGGMAEVFDAFSVGASGFRRRVAIKRMFASDAGDPAMLRMFLDEARICSALHHTGIVSIFDFGVVEGSPFQVMEFVDGVNAAEASRILSLRGTGMPEVVALHVCRSVARALAYAHEARDGEGPLGIVHRDVKPGNILLSWGGDVKLADFGIALGRARSERTEAGQVKGTPNYMAPEQLTGFEVDARADVFSLGCVLHALLAGASPITGLTTSLQLLRGDEAPLDPRIAPDVAEVIRSAMRAEPAARLPSARAMAEALDALIARRTPRDPRPELEALLASLRPAEPAPRGKLDELLDLAFVPTATAEREYTLLPTRTVTLRDPAQARPSTPPLQSPTVPRLAAGLTDAAHGRSTRVALAAAVVVLAAALGGGWAWLGKGTPANAAGGRAADEAGPAIEARSAAAPPVAPGAAGAAPSAAPGTATPADEVVPATSSAEPAPARPGPLAGPGARRTSAPTRTTPTAETPLRPPSAPAGEGTGFVAFRALEGATRTTIVVDGVPRGFAPKVLELSVGPHAVAFIDQAGKRFGATQVAVRQDYSRASPKTVDVTASGD
ncbi:MAG TPA: protein kinase [Gaiellaceae bacterium]|nr:protein kinase [Gaiellaceae bacterium]